VIPGSAYRSDGLSEGLAAPPGEATSSLAEAPTLPPRIGRFVPERLLGRGRSGSAFKVVDPLRPGRELALKILSAPQQPPTEEFWVGSVVRHRTLVEVLEAGTIEDHVSARGVGQPYLLMDYFPGEALKPGWSPQDLEALAFEVLDGLDAIHAAGWIHGDLHPGNLLARRAGSIVEARILDFGRARRAEGGRGEPALGGTPRYLAPELLKGQPADHRADLYAAGALFLEALGVLEHRPIGEHLLRTRRGELFAEVLRLPLPERLGPLIRGLLEPDPEHRLASAAQAKALLARAAGAKTPAAGARAPLFESPRTVGGGDFEAILEHSLDAALRARPRSSTICLSGDPGSGKSRRLREALARAYSRGLRGWTWPQLLADVADEEAGAKAHAPAAGERELAGPCRAEELAAEDRLRRAARLLDRAAERPALLAIDDVDALPLEERRLALAIAAALQSHPHAGIVLAMARASAASSDAAFSRAWTAIERQPGTARVRLEPWSADESRRYLAEALRPRRDLGAWEPAIIEAGRGSPGALRQLLEALAARGELRLESGAWVLSRSEKRGLPSLPCRRRRFQEAWRSLDAEARELLTGAAIIGDFEENVRLALLARATSLEVEVAASRLKRLVEIEPFRHLEIDGSGDARRLRGLTAELRLAVLRSAGPGPRRRWRERLAGGAGSGAAVAAQRIRQGCASLAEVLAAAAPGGRAAERLLARHARSCEAFAAVDCLASAARLAELLAARGDHVRAARHLRSVRDASPLPEARAAARLSLAEMALARGDVAEARAELDGVERDRGAGARPPKARWLFLSAIARHLEGELEAGLDIAGEAQRLYPELPAFDGLAGNLLLAAGRVGAAKAALGHGLRRARRSGQEGLCASLLTNLGRLFARQGLPRRAAGAHRLASALFERQGMRSQASLADANLGTALRRSGAFLEAAAAARRCLKLRAEIGDEAGLAVAEANLGLVYRELGLPGTALRHFRSASKAIDSERGAAALPRDAVDLVRAGIALAAGDVGDGRQARAQARAALAAVAGASPPPFEAAPEHLLLALRFWDLAGGAVRDAVESFLERGAVRPHHAPALWEALRPRDAGASGAPAASLPESLAAAARAVLARLACASPRAAFYHRLTLLDATEGASERLDALEAQIAAVESFPERDARRQAMVQLLRIGIDGARAARLRAGLRRLLDEMLFDLDARDRPSFERRPEIQEALAMAKTTLAEDREDREASRSASVLAQVFRLNREILEEEEVDALFSKIVDAAVELCGAERGVLALRRQGYLAIAAARSRGRDLADAENKVSWTIIERSIARRAAALATNAREDLELGSIASVEDLDLRSVICAPLVAKDESLGALYLDNPFAAAVFSPRDLELLEHFCGQALLAWQSAERRRELAGLLERLEDANRRLDGELEATRKEARRKSQREERRFHGIVGDSPALRAVFQLVEAVAPTEIPLLITGESGTGKELVARAVHNESLRADRPFVVENCAAVPAALLESALFGHVKGAFTGADRNRRGLFELADGGTLFLDEIAEMPVELQTRLLRVLQEGEVRPVGSSELLRVDVRVIAATNRDVREAVRQGKLREDLYYRLQGAEIRLPALRERREDIPLLVEHFLGRAPRARERPLSVSSKAMARLVEYPWPGNVRELENEVRRLAVLSGGPTIGLEALAPHVREGAGLAGPAQRGDAPPPVRPLAAVEREAIVNAMRSLRGQRGKAAEALGISRSTLYLKLREIGYEEMGED
jgi:transcriptional regulator with GAF, ATPase, and Fis domain